MWMLQNWSLLATHDRLLSTTQTYPLFVITITLKEAALKDRPKRILSNFRLGNRFEPKHKDHFFAMNWFLIIFSLHERKKSENNPIHVPWFSLLHDHVGLSQHQCRRGDLSPRCVAAICRIVCHKPNGTKKVYFHTFLRYLSFLLRAKFKRTNLKQNEFNAYTAKLISSWLLMIACSLKQENHTLVQKKCHNGTSWILKRAAKWKWNRSNGKKCENQTISFFILFFFDHRSLIRNNTETAVTNMTIHAFYCHVCHRSLCVISFLYISCGVAWAYAKNRMWQPTGDYLPKKAKYG